MEGNRIESFPGWYPNTHPVQGRLALFDPSNTDNLKGHIPFAGLKYGAVSNTGLIKLTEKVHEAGAVGLIVAVRNFDDSRLLTAANAEQKGQGPEYYQVPLPLPTVIVAGDDESKMIETASAGQEASIKITGVSRENVTAYNVVGYPEKRGSMGYCNHALLRLVPMLRREGPGSGPFPGLGPMGGENGFQVQLHFAWPTPVTRWPI